jgi:plasmid replication initiation protein
MAKKSQNKGIVLIKKSNELIESRFKFDIWEMRFFLSVISQIRREDDDFRVYRVWYSDIIKTFGIKTHQSYDMLREAANKLMKKTFIIDSSADGFARKKVYHIIRMVDYLAEGQEKKRGVENQEYIDVTIETDLKPFLLQLQRSFTAYDIRNVIKLGAYPIRVYELLKQYESIGHRTLGFEEMKRMFELEKEYPRFATFYQRVIAPAIKEINNYTDLEILKVDKLKQGKKVTGVNIKFRSKVSTPQVVINPIPVTGETLSKTPMPDIRNEDLMMVEINTTAEMPDAQDNDDRIKKLYPKIVESLGVTPSVFFDLLNAYTDQQIEQAVRVTNRAKMEGQIKTNPSGFFVQALKNGYTDQKEERAKKQRKEEQEKHIAEQMSAFEMEKENQIFDRIRHLTSENPELTLEAIALLRLTEGGKAAIQQEESRLARPLEVEDFRQNKTLRKLLIDTLFIKNIEKFADIIQDYEAKVNALNQTTIF